MKDLISMFIVLALVMTTSLPTMSHAMMMPHDSAKTEQANTSDEGDCHKHANAKAEQSRKTAQNDKDSKDSSGECCKQGICKCGGGTCHNGVSNIFGNGSEPLFSLTASNSSFGFTDDLVESALSNRLKRPPKA